MENSHWYICNLTLEWMVQSTLHSWERSSKGVQQVLFEEEEEGFGSIVAPQHFALEVHQ